MKYSAILNNYQIGSPELRCTRTDKIISKERLDSYHTKVIWEDLTNQELEYIIKIVFGGKKYKVKEELR